MPEPDKENLPLTITESKSGIPTASYNSLRLHSAYNPQKEAETAISSLKEQNFETAVFEGFGLGYMPITFSRHFFNKSIIVIEPDINHLFAAFMTLDWEKVLSMPSCIFAISAAPEFVIQLLEHQGLKNCIFLGTQAYKTHAQDYFESLQALIKRNQRKDKLNSNTLARFYPLWLKNACHNLEQYANCPGLSSFKDAASMDLPFTVLGAGPSLRRIAPLLKEIKKRSVLVATDTALRICLEQGVEPDFIILMDPQYWAWMHIAGLNSPSSVLITEGTVYPAAFHFNCEKIILASSMFPMLRVFEERTCTKGKIAAGGSVSTAAWDFARICGTKNIFLAGLDLGFPGGQTHYRGCTFEEKAHSNSTRTHNAESANCNSLFSADLVIKKDYNGNPIKSDSRMTMFAWWFESNVAKAKEEDCHTWTLCPEGLAIPGIKQIKEENFLKLGEVSPLKESFFKNAWKNCKENSISKEEILKSIKDFKSSLQKINQNAKEAYYLCENYLLEPKKSNISYLAKKLDSIERNISESSIKDIANLVLPDKEKTDSILADIAFSEDKNIASVQKTKAIYKAVLDSSDEFLRCLQ